MPVPVVAILGQVAIRFLTSPQTWQTIGAVALVFIGAGFSMKLFLGEAAATIAKLWWVIVLILLFLLGRIALPIYITERARTRRTQLTGNNTDVE